MRFAVLGMTLLGFCCSVNGQTNQHVIQLSVDGLHSEGLRWLMDSQPESFTGFQRFVDEGSTTFNARTDVTNTFTLPNHTSMLTGRPVNQTGDNPIVHHGYTNNSTPKATDTLHNAGNENLDYVASTFDVAHDYGLNTAMYVSKPKFVIFEQSYNATDQTNGGRTDQFLENGDQGTDKIDQYLYLDSNGTSTELVDRFVADMPDERFDYTFLHLSEPDVAGHRSGWRSDAWEQSVALVDQHLSRILEMVQQDETLRESTTIILTTDHGGLGLFHDDESNPNMYTIPFFVWGQGVAAGTDLYELNRGTRVRPLDMQIPYEAETQPIRNGDGGNLALSLLGLPAVDGSTINARQDLLIHHAGQAVWHGSNPIFGEPGDGVSWQDPANWSRNGEQDAVARPGDSIVFAANSEQEVVQLGGPRTARSIEFLGDYALRNGDLHLVSGAIDVADGAVVQFAGQITSQASLVIHGAGAVEINGSITDVQRMGGPIGGDLNINGSATIFHDVSPGSEIGTISIGRDLTLASTSLLRMEIGKSAEGSVVHDAITVGKRLIIRCGMEVETQDSYSDPEVAGEFDQFRFLSVGRRVGALRFLEYDGERLNFDLGTTESLRHFVGQGLFRILEHDDTGITLTNYRAFPGDANGDGAFNTQDLVAVFQFGVYEDGIANNADWLSGDWNNDQEFTSSDFVVALSTGRFEMPPPFGHTTAKTVPEPRPGFMLPLLTLYVASFHRLSSKARR